MVKRVLLAGDWHGNQAWASACFGLAAQHRCDAVVQLGDFGLWPGREDSWLDHVEAEAVAAGVELVWIDGNHENHDLLDRWKLEADPQGLVRMRPHVRWATRGARWEWSGVRFGALGGAVSIDRFLRRSGVNWWEQEAVTESDVARLGDERLDVLLTHAAPRSAQFPPFPPLPLPGGIIEDSRRVRDLLEEAVQRTHPQLVVHGHHHMRLTTETPDRRIVGLAHDKAGGSDAWAVLQLDPELELVG